MPPKGKGQRLKPKNDLEIPQRSLDDLTGGNFREMSPARSNRTGIRGKGKGRATNSGSDAVPNVFHDMLAEALSPLNVDEPERPRKRRRMKHMEDDHPIRSSTVLANQAESHGDDDASTEFKDIVPNNQQTAYDDSGDSSADSDVAWEEVGIKDYELKSGDADEQGDLDLTLTAEKSTQPRSSVARRRTVGKAERALRLSIHKMHILCLLSHVDRRNNWCNDSAVQSALKPLITKQMLECLKPKQSYTQFGRAESVKKGLTLVIKMWESKFTITKKGMQRSFWAGSEKDLQDVGKKVVIIGSFC
jgi:xeroderma pigmentosum group C-complementing protein